MSSRRTAGAVFGVVLCIYLTTTGGSFATDLASYEVTKNLVQRGSVAMSYNVLETEAERGLDGQYYAPVGIGHPLIGVPFYFGSQVFQRLFSVRLGKPETLDKAAVVLASAVTAALCAPLVFLFAWRLTGVWVAPCSLLSRWRSEHRSGLTQNLDLMRLWQRYVYWELRTAFGSAFARKS